jgi:hypothetical protein
MKKFEAFFTIVLLLDADYSLPFVKAVDDDAKVGHFLSHKGRSKEQLLRLGKHQKKLGPFNLGDKNSFCELNGGQGAPQMLPAPYADQSVLLIGDSTDRMTIQTTCDLFKVRREGYLKVKLNNMGSTAYDYCALPTAGAGNGSSGLIMAQFMHYGVSSEVPLYRYAYTQQKSTLGVPVGLHDTPRSHILYDATGVRNVLPGTWKGPTLVVAQSYLWDLAQAYQNGHEFGANKSKLEQWVHDVRRFLLLLRYEAFPCSEIAWRTAPPASGYGRSPSLLAKMNSAALAMISSDSELRDAVHIINWGEIFAGRDQSKSPTHPVPGDRLRYSCLVLELLRRLKKSPAANSPGGRNMTACRRPSVKEFLP